MRIVTRPDLDGVVCAALINDVETITEPTLWVEPGDMQNGTVPIRPGDIIANLPPGKGCSLWFDHHVTNRPVEGFKGAFDIAPSAARMVYGYYQGRFSREFEPLVRMTDQVDSADFTRDEIETPEKYPHILLSMTIHGQDTSDAPYWNRLVQLLQTSPLEEVMTDPETARRCRETVIQNGLFHDLLRAHTRIIGSTAVTDFRPLWPVPEGNRYLVYALFPEASVSIRIRYRDPEGKVVSVSVGRSILNPSCRVNVGKMLTRFGGGGHAGAGACTIASQEAPIVIQQLTDILLQNQEVEQ